MPVSHALWLDRSIVRLDAGALAPRVPAVVVPGHMAADGALDVSAVTYTRDYLLAFDFAPDGRLTIFNNGALPAGAYSATFDFGTTLAAPIVGFSLLDAGITTGAPRRSPGVNRCRGRP